MGVNYGYFWSELTFDGETDADIDRRGMTATLERRLTDKATLQLAAGGVFGGHLDVLGARYQLGPGWLAALSFSYAALQGEDDLPFVMISVSGGVSGARTEEQVRPGAPEGERETLTAIDARVGLVVGKTLWKALSPYLGVRAFGGPVLWHARGEDRNGTDQHHYQVAAGLLASLPRGFDLYAELAPLGERAVAVGGGFAF